MVKIASYGVMHFIVAVGVAYALTGSVSIALGIGLVEPVVQTFAYALHEHFWRGREAKLGTGGGMAFSPCFAKAVLQKPDA